MVKIETKILKGKIYIGKEIYKFTATKWTEDDFYILEVVEIYNGLTYSHELTVATFNYKFNAKAIDTFIRKKWEVK
jgi:hypothetical protein